MYRVCYRGAKPAWQDHLQGFPMSNPLVRIQPRGEPQASPPPPNQAESSCQTAGCPVCRRLGRGRRVGELGHDDDERGRGNGEGWWESGCGAAMEGHGRPRVTAGNGDSTVQSRTPASHVDGLPSVSTRHYDALALGELVSSGRGRVGKRTASPFFFPFSPGLHLTRCNRPTAREWPCTPFASPGCIRPGRAWRAPSAAGT